MYDISITYHQGTDRECGYDETMPTLDSSVTRLNALGAGHGSFFRCWINDKEIHVINGRLVGTDGKSFCSNQEWHDKFAPISYPKIIRKFGGDNPETMAEKAFIEKRAARSAIAEKIVSSFVEQGLPCARLDFED